MQLTHFGDCRLLFFFHGTKCFYAVDPLSIAEKSQLPKVVFTDGEVPYEPMAQLHSRQRPVQDTNLDLWARCLGFTPDHVASKTLSATSQLVPTVEAETREMMRDHFQTRLPELKVRYVNYTCYVDTFFLSYTSVRGFLCWNLYCFQRTGLDVAYLMRRRAQGPTTLP